MNQRSGIPELGQSPVTKVCTVFGDPLEYNKASVRRVEVLVELLSRLSLERQAVQRRLTRVEAGS